MRDGDAAEGGGEDSRETLACYEKEGEEGCVAEVFAGAEQVEVEQEDGDFDGGYVERVEDFAGIHVLGWCK